MISSILTKGTTSCISSRIRAARKFSTSEDPQNSNSTLLLQLNWVKYYLATVIRPGNETELHFLSKQHLFSQLKALPVAKRNLSITRMCSTRQVRVKINAIPSSLTIFIRSTRLCLRFGPAPTASPNQSLIRGSQLNKNGPCGNLTLKDMSWIC